MAMMGWVTDLQNFLDDQIEGLKRSANAFLETGDEGWWKLAIGHAFYFVKLGPQMRERVALRDEFMADYLEFCVGTLGALSALQSDNDEGRARGDEAGNRGLCSTSRYVYVSRKPKTIQLLTWPNSVALAALLHAN